MKTNLPRSRERPPQDMMKKGLAGHNRPCAWNSRDKAC
jgi:hypothetical protein